MTIIELLCVFCAAGWAVGFVALILVILVGNVSKGKKPTHGVGLLCLLLIALVAAGFVGCAAEDRVCEAAAAERANP